MKRIMMKLGAKGIVVGLFCAVLAASGSRAETYKIDAAHTEVAFSARHLMISNVKGNFQKFEGTVQYDPEDLAKWSVTGTIDASTINTANADRDKHLKGADFLDAEKFPTVSFRSKSFRKTNDGYVCVGDLTLHGVTKEIEIPFSISGVVKDPWGNNRIGGEARVKINRVDYGIKFNKTLDNGGLVVGNEIAIELTGEAVKQP